MTSTQGFPLRAVLNKGQVALGAWLTLPSTAIARQMALIPELSWILVDAEHGLINDTHLYDLCNTISSAGLSPIVRVPIDQDWWIKRALDAGAHGLMVPMGHDANVAKKVVSFAKYPPVGIRGYGPMFTHAAGATGASYVEIANRDILVIVQIESQQGVENIDEILAVDGLDHAFIGPYDLAMSLGVKPNSEEHQAAITKVLKACEKAGKAASIFSIDGKDAARRKSQGFKMISVATDIDTIAGGFQQHVAQALGEDTLASKSSGGYGGNL